MFIGAQYYRPPNPPGKDWERDLKKICVNDYEISRSFSEFNPYQIIDRDGLSNKIKQWVSKGGVLDVIFDGLWQRKKIVNN